jgi:AraC-like DNA-binding protein
VERLVSLGADHPAIVARRNAEQVAGRQHEFAAVAHFHCDAAGNDKPDVPNLAKLGPCCWADMLGPTPTWLVHRSSYLEPADPEQLEAPKRKRPHLDWICKIDDLDDVRHATILPSLQLIVLDDLAPNPRLEDRARFLRPPALPGVEALYATFVHHRYPPHVHDYWVIACVDRGAATFEVEGRRHTAAAGSTFAIPPGAAHTGEPATPGGYTYRVLYVDWPAVMSDVDLRDENSFRASPVSHDRRCLHALNRLHQALVMPAHDLEQGEALAAVYRALRATAAPWARPRPPRAHPAVARAEAFIEEHWRENFALHDLADSAGVSAFHLVRIFHRDIGMPPSAYRRALRIQAAQKLLRNGEPARDVALACGFYDQAHLTRHFKAVTGVTPSRYSMAARLPRRMQQPRRTQG